MYHTNAASILACGLVLATMLTSNGASPNPPAQNPRLLRNDAVNVPYSGTVTEVSKDTITIQWKATPGEKPKTFALSEPLASGMIPMIPRLIPGRERGYSVLPNSMYPIADVKVGDWVTIKYAHLAGVDICDHICIQRRPDGLVPPLPEEAEILIKDSLVIIFKAKFPGTPIPHELQRKGYVPYHEVMNTYWAKVAPMPREKGALPPKIMQ